MVDQKKKLKIEIGVILVLLLAFALFVTADILRAGVSADLTPETATSVLEQTLALLPATGTDVSAGQLASVSFQVDAVESTDTREYTVTCSYRAKALLPLYQMHKQLLFEKAYLFYMQEKEAGRMTNSAKIRQYLLPLLEDWLKDPDMLSAYGTPIVTGSVSLQIFQVSKEVAKGDVLAIELDGAFFRVYLADEPLDALTGGLLSVRKDIAATETVECDGQTVDLHKMNTLRTGISDCFGLYAYSSEKPDPSSSVFLSSWNSFVFDFKRNFIEDARWEYLTKGLLTTMEITLCAALLGVVLGFICAIVRCTHDKTGKLMIADQIVRLYLTVIRGTPVMVQLLIIYFVILLPIGIEKMPAAILCFSINSGAYVAEIIRGGIMAVDSGQMEAGRSLGLNYIQTMRSIVMPQAFKAVLPALVNEFIALLKESSVAFYIGVADLTQGGLKIRSITYSNFMPLIAVAVIYLIVVLILTRLVGVLERRLRKSER